MWKMFSVIKKFFTFLINTSLGTVPMPLHGDPKYLNKIIDDLGIQIEVDESDLEKIPNEGAFVTVSNHHFGGLDGVVVTDIVLRRRSDFKLMATPILWKIFPLTDYFIRFDTSKNRSQVKTSFAGNRMSFSHLQKGHPLGMFPAGEVATYNSDTKTITDKVWKEPYINFLHKVKYPIVPIYIQGANSNFFHMFSSISPLLTSAGEIFGKKKVIKVRIGSPITSKETMKFEDIDLFGRYLRAKTYALETKIEVRKFFLTALKRNKDPEPIIDQVPLSDIKEELNRITDKYQLFKNGRYAVYCVPTTEIPNIHREIGRKREITFRQVGEGTNRSIDIDEFDLYYHQLFIWDEEDNQLVGAYRVGMGREIIQQFGVKGFYIQSLFKISKQFIPILEESMELGRSFITQEYQRKPMSLFLLWKGILYFLLKHPEYRYLLGPVSISNEFSKFSKDLIIKFIRRNNFDHELGKLITPRKRFKVHSKYDTDIVLETAENDINKVDKFISDIEPTNFRIPVLLKKYLKQNAKIIGFNIDPKFNNALDGLIILDLFEVPFNTIESLSKEIQDESILDRFKETGDCSEGKE